MKKIYALLAALVLALGCGMGDTTDSSEESTVVFEVTGPAHADVTWGVGGNQTQDLGAKTPWTKTATTTAPVIAAVVAQSKGDGPITCRVTVDGAKKAENTSTGQFAVVTCTS